MNICTIYWKRQKMKETFKGWCLVNKSLDVKIFLPNVLWAELGVTEKIKIKSIKYTKKYYVPRICYTSDQCLLPTCVHLLYYMLSSDLATFICSNLVLSVSPMSVSAQVYVITLHFYPSEHHSNISHLHQLIYFHAYMANSVSLQLSLLRASLKYFAPSLHPLIYFHLCMMQ